MLDTESTTEWKSSLKLSLYIHRVIPEHAEIRIDYGNYEEKIEMAHQYWGNTKRDVDNKTHGYKRLHE